VAEWAELVPAGEWNFSYRFDLEQHDGMRDRREDLSREEIHALGFERFADEFSRETQTLSLAYGLEGDCTLFVTLPWVDAELDSTTETAAELEREGNGVGDLSIGLTRLWHHGEEQRLVASLAVGLPTGSIDEEQGGELLPYALQPGTGTVDFFPGVAWTRSEPTWSWGVAARARIHAGENDQDWAWSDSLTLDGWLTVPLDPHVSAGLHLRNTSWGDVHGGASELDPDRDPLEDDGRQGGTRTDGFLRLAWRGKSVRVEVELGGVLDERLDGSGPSTEWMGVVGLRFGL